MKKLCCIAAAATMFLLLLTACGGYKVSESGTWTDGTYSTTVKGKNGEFDISIVIEDGVMVSITIGDNDETEELGGVAISELPVQMLENQTYDVDVVSGATTTSNALIKGVAKCLEAASEEALSGD